MAVVAPEVRVRQRAIARPVRPRRRLGRRPGRRALSERLTLNVVVGVVAALLAFVLAASLLKDRREMITVAVARERISVGTTVTEAMVVAEKVPAGTGFASSLVLFSRIGSAALVATRTVQAGEPLTSSAVGGPGTASGHRVMSISLKSWQAANGEVQTGDQVDVIETTKTGARYVLTNAAVVGRSSSTSGGLSGGLGSGDLVISVEVNSMQALDLAAAIEAGTITVVRSTGAAPIESPVTIVAPAG
jgi:Flp pilus assembly protein CpaB